LIRNISFQSAAMIINAISFLIAFSLIARNTSIETIALYGLTSPVMALGYAIARSGATQGLILIENITRKHIASSYIILIGIVIILSLIVLIIA